MSILMWRIVCIAFAVLFIASVVTLIVTNLTKNNYYRNYHDDELLKKTKSVNSVNSIYLTSGETKKFIKKYVVCKTVYEKYVVCNFADKYDEIRFFVAQFNKRKKVIGVLDVTQKFVDGDSSKIIGLKRRCAFVNVIVSSVNGLVINQDYVRPISMFRLRIYALLKSVAVFSALIVLRHFVIELVGSSLIFGKDHRYQYLNNLFNYIAVGASLALSAISYVITVLAFRRKNAKSANGGALEYEFV